MTRRAAAPPAGADGGCARRVVSSLPTRGLRSAAPHPSRRTRRLGFQREPHCRRRRGSPGPLRCAGREPLIQCGGGWRRTMVVDRPLLPMRGAFRLSVAGRRRRKTRIFSVAKRNALRTGCGRRVAGPEPDGAGGRSGARAAAAPYPAGRQGERGAARLFRAGPQVTLGHRPARPGPARPLAFAFSTVAGGRIARGGAAPGRAPAVGPPASERKFTDSKRLQEER